MRSRFIEEPMPQQAQPFWPEQSQTDMPARDADINDIRYIRQELATIDARLSTIDQRLKYIESRITPSKF